MNTGSRELDLKEAEMGAKYRTLTINEVRQRQGAEGLDEDSLKQMIDEWSLITPVADEAPKTAEKTSLPDVVLRRDIPTVDEMEDELETDLHQMIDEATRDIISTMRKARS